MSLQLKRLGEIDRHSIFVRLSWLEGARVHLLIYSNCVALGMAGSRARIYPGESTIPQCGQDRPMLFQAASHHSGLLLTHPDQVGRYAVHEGGLCARRYCQPWNNQPASSRVSCRHCFDEHHHRRTHSIDRSNRGGILAHSPDYQHSSTRLHRVPGPVATSTGFGQSHVCRSCYHTNSGRSVSQNSRSLHTECCNRQVSCAEHRSSEQRDLGH